MSCSSSRDRHIRVLWSIYKKLLCWLLQQIFFFWFFSFSSERFDFSCQQQWYDMLVRIWGTCHCQLFYLIEFKYIFNAITYFIWKRKVKIYFYCYCLFHFHFTFYTMKRFLILIYPINNIIETKIWTIVEKRS